MQPRRTGRTLTLVSMLAVSAVVLAGTAAALPSISTQARFATPAAYLASPGTTAAITYDRASVPVGSWVRVTQGVNKKGGMDVRLQVRGLRPSSRYVAYVDIAKCTDNPAGAGKHLQNGPSGGHYEGNEFWLPFATDTRGRAAVLTQQYWGIGRGQKANSVMIHRRAGNEPVACVTVPFKRIWPW